MSERDNLASVPEEPTHTTADKCSLADEALINHEEQIQGGGDDDEVGEVMVEVVGSDVFVDGVGSEGGSGNWDDEEDGVKDKVESDEGGNSGQIGAFDSPSRKICTESKGEFEGTEEVVTASSAGQIIQEGGNDERPEGDDGKHLFVRGENVDNEDLASERADEVQHSEAEVGSLAISSASTMEHTHIRVTEEVEVTVVQETRDYEMVEEGLEKVGKSVDEVNSCTLTKRTSTGPSSMEDKEANPETSVEKTSSVHDQAEECQNIDEDYAVCPNAEGLAQQAKVTVSKDEMMNKEKSTNSQPILFRGIDDHQQLQVDVSAMDAEEQDATRDTVGDKEAMTLDQTTLKSDDQQQLQVDISTMEAEKQDATRDTVGDEEEMIVDQTTLDSDDKQQLQVGMSVMETEKKVENGGTIGDKEEMIVDQTTLESDDRQQLQVDMSAMDAKEKNLPQNSTRDTVDDKDTMIVDQTTLGSDDAIASDIKDLKSEVSVCEEPHLSNQQIETDIANEMRLDISKDEQSLQIELTFDNGGEHGHLESSTEQASIIEKEDVAEMDKVSDVKNEIAEVCTPLSDDSKFTEIQPAETSIADTVVDQSMNLMLVNETSDVEGHIHAASHDVNDSSVSLDEKINCHSSQHIIAADVQPSDIFLQVGNHNTGSCIMDIDYSTAIAEKTSEANIPSKEETGGTFEVEVRDESTVCNLVVDLDTCMDKEGVCNSLDDECKENVSFVDKSHFVDEIQPMESEMTLQVSDGLDGSGTELYFDGYTLEVDVEDGGIGLEQLEMEEEAVGEEQANDGDDIDPKLTDMKDGNISRVHQPSYLLPPETGEFSVSDLVWGKVKSHPWWPGQIFDSVDASDKAIKYHKKDGFLVAYFGDRTFAWNEASVLKPFRAHFSQAERHSSSEALQNAVNCALEEVSRRVELGLICPCMPKDVFDKIEAQIIENAGIREQSSRRPGIDKSLGADTFQADKLLNFVKELAEFPLDGSDRLNLVAAKAQLLAFNRQRGYQQLSEFQTCEALQENEMDFPESTDMIEHATEGESRISLKIQKSNTNKRKHNLRDVMYPSKKDRSLSDLMGEERRISFYSAKVSTTSPSTPKPSFKMGDCIRRAASQLTGNPSILKPNNDAFSIDESIESPMGPDAQNPQGSGFIFSMETSSAAEMLAQLYLVAVDPKKVYNSMSAISTFFSSFRNSISVHFSGRQNAGGVKKRKASQVNGSPEEFEFDEVNDSYWAERIIQNGSEELVAIEGQDRVVEYQPVILNGSIKSGRRPYSRKRFSNGGSETPLDGLAKADVGRKAENAPAELVLNFSENDLVPVETSLNKIFRRFGPIQELETEVDPESCRARVIFKRCSDAEVAFSSAGAFNIFGPMIVNYQLNYTPSPHFKSPPLALLEGQEDAT